MKTKYGFTLIELMIVIAIIGILMGATFKLMQVAADSKARAVTIARMERLQNALSGYYSAYGMYPAVPLYGNPDPSGAGQFGESDGKSIDPGTQSSAQAAARAQPVAFEYPTPQWMDDGTPPIITGLFPLDHNVVSVNTKVESLDKSDGDWNKYKGFKFGLMSFLVPRVQIVGHPDDGKKAPKPEVYGKAQWTINNVNPDLSNLKKQRLLENETCIRWLPCFEDILRSFADSIILKDTDNNVIASVHVNGDPGGGHCLVERKMGETTVGLALITITDGWGREFFYHSLPPYQSFQVWSAGPDGITFPPWIPIPSSGGMSKAKVWIKDDIVGGKMQL